MTLSQLRAFHQRWHAGYIWDCPHCAEQWRKLKQEEKEKNENE